MSAAEVPAVHALLELLENEGVRHIFGVPGGPLTALFEAMYERKTIDLVLAKHESGAAFMAAAHARVSGGLAVCCATSGPGATNALTGIASARADSLPVLLLTGQVATHVFGKGAIQESTVYGTDIVSLFAPVTKLSTALPSAERTPDIVQTAIRTALSGRRGPVHLCMPADLLKRPVRFTARQPEKSRSRSNAVDQDGISRAAQLLASAKRPCILAGHGVAIASATDALYDLAHCAEIPVATSPKGKGVFSETDPLSMGVLGFGGHDLAEKYFSSGDVDVLLIVGSSLNEFVTNAWTVPMDARTAVIQIDIDPVMIGRNYPVDLALVGDARANLAELCARMRPLVRETPRPPADPLRSLRETTARFHAADSISSDSSPIKPQRLVREIREAMPDDALLFVDNGNSIIWGTHYFEIRRPNTYFIDLGLAAMGSAVAGVVGGAMAAPGRPAVALVGDAAFAMHGFEVHTAVERNLPIVWVVLNNGGHGMVNQGDRLMRGKDFGVSLFRVPLDVAGLARAMGAAAVRVEKPLDLRRALTDALASGGPVVIDALIDASEEAPTLARRVETLAQFFAMRRRTDPPRRRTDPPR